MPNSFVFIHIFIHIKSRTPSNPEKTTPGCSIFVGFVWCLLGFVGFGKPNIYVWFSTSPPTDPSPSLQCPQRPSNSSPAGREPGCGKERLGSRLSGPPGYRHVVSRNMSGIRCSGRTLCLVGILTDLGLRTHNIFLETKDDDINGTTREPPKLFVYFL